MWGSCDGGLQSLIAQAARWARGWCKTLDTQWLVDTASAPSCSCEGLGSSTGRHWLTRASYVSQHILPLLKEIPGPLHQLLSLATEPPPSPWAHHASLFSLSQWPSPYLSGSGEGCLVALSLSLLFSLYYRMNSVYVLFHSGLCLLMLFEESSLEVKMCDYYLFPFLCVPAA